jgi:methylmalonyl-CoA mutase
MEIYQPTHPIRFITAAALFDGHDAAINMYRRLLQGAGVEVVHLGHNRSVAEVVKAALEEDVQGIAVSSYQGGHMEYFKYMYDLLQQQGAGHIRIFGGGGGVIVADEIRALEAYGITRIFSPEDGRQEGLEGIINTILTSSDIDLSKLPTPQTAAMQIARALTLTENGIYRENGTGGKQVPVIGITGTGGAGKSSLIDELLRRFALDFPDKRFAVLALDPTKRKTGGALLGDRIRMNAAFYDNVFMRSMATRRSHLATNESLLQALQVLRDSDFDVIFVETSGIGQADSEIVDIADYSMYVMTSEYGASTQLEKIDMLDFADIIVINKFERRGSEDALRDVRRQYRRNRQLGNEVRDEDLPVFGTIASQYGDAGVDALFADLCQRTGLARHRHKAMAKLRCSTPHARMIPEDRQNYLGEIVRTIRDYQRQGEEQVNLVRDWESLTRAAEISKLPELETLAGERQAALQPLTRDILDNYSRVAAGMQQEVYTYHVRGREFSAPTAHESLAGSRISRVALPRFHSQAERLRFLWRENLPGFFPYTAGVFPFKRSDEEPRRQFAGEGTPARTNQRFHYLSRNDPAKRLSVAFDSVTLYGEDPDERPDIFGKIGESGVSICTLADMQQLFAGFDLLDPNTSVSMTINGPAPIILAMFMQTAIAQQVESFTEEHQRPPKPSERAALEAKTLATVRGTVQADILKEDQAQNTCIFATDFALKMMGDIQAYFVEHQVRNYYSVSISGYHIAEAGANPITQLATTLANGFTYVEYYLSRGMHIDDFAPNLSFFFSNGLDPEYTVLGRVARRIWAIAMRNYYAASERSQKLKYHIQTSGRSLHAQEVDFNDIRTTLQALLAIMDNCNSLHTNAYDEAITTPTEGSVRRAMAIQLIVNREFGLTKNENPLQGSFIVEEVTDLVEEAMLDIFLELNRRGGVLGAMESQYQRLRIQEESLHYERLKHSGELPLIGVNTFLPEDRDEMNYEGELTRASQAEKKGQLNALRGFQKQHKKTAAEALARLHAVAVAGENIFAELMQTVQHASLGQITEVLYRAGGQYRRNL